MKVLNDDGNMVEIGDLRECPFCGNTDNIRVTAKATYDELVAENGSSLVKIFCRKCDMEMNQFDIPNNEYFFGMGLLISKWNRRGVIL